MQESVGREGGGSSEWSGHTLAAVIAKKLIRIHSRLVKSEIEDAPTAGQEQDGGEDS